MKTIYLCRHGQSDTNIGKTDSHPNLAELTDVGRHQARSLGRKLAQLDIQHVATSKLKRSQDTAQPFLHLHGEPMPTSILPIEEFVYLGADRCTNTTAAERRALRMEFWKNLNAQIKDDPNEESFEDFSLRIRGLIKLMEELPDKTAIIGHALFNVAVIELIKNREHTDQALMAILFDRLYVNIRSVPNAGVLTIHIKGKKISLPHGEDPEETLLHHPEERYKISAYKNQEAREIKTFPDILKKAEQIKHQHSAVVILKEDHGEENPANNGKWFHHQTCK